MSLNISDFILFYFFFVKIALPWKKLLPSFPATPSQSWGPVQAPFWKFGRRFNPPQQKGGGGGCTLCCSIYWFVSIAFSMILPNCFSFCICSYPTFMSQQTFTCLKSIKETLKKGKKYKKSTVMTPEHNINKKDTSTTSLASF